MPLRAKTFTRGCLSTGQLSYQEAFAHIAILCNFYTQKLWHTEPFIRRKPLDQHVFTDRCLCTQTLSLSMEALHIDVSTHRRLHTHTHSHTHTPAHTESLHTQYFLRPVPFTRSKTLHPGAVGRRSFYTQMRLHICSYTQTTRQPFFTEALAHGCLYTKHAKAFTHSCCQQMFLHTEVFALTLLRIVRASAFLHSSCYARKPFTRTHRCFYTRASTYGKLLHTESFTRGGLYKQAFTCRSSCTREREPCTAAKR